MTYLRLAMSFIAMAILSLPAFAQINSAYQSKDSDKIIASRGGAEVSFGDIDARVAEVPPHARFGFMNSPTRIESTLSSLLLNRQLADEALKNRLDKDADVVSALTEVENDLLLRLWTGQQLRAENIDLERAKQEYFQAHRSSYLNSDLFNVRHILFSTECASKESAQASALQVHQRLVDDSSLFTELAKEHSGDFANAQSGGVLPISDLSDFVPEFSAAVRKLSVGEISLPVETPFGIHIIRLDSIEKGSQLDYASVSDTIEAKLLELQAEKIKRIVAADGENDAVSVSKSIIAKAKSDGIQDSPLYKYQLQILKERILAQARIRQLLKDFRLNSADVMAREQYIIEKKKYIVPESVTIRELLISKKCSSNSIAQSAAQAAHTQLVSGVTMDEIRKAHGAQSGFAISSVEEHKIALPSTDESLNAALSQLNDQGDISSVNEREHGYTILQLVSRTPAKQLSFDEVKPQIIDRIVATMADRNSKMHIDRLQSLAIEAEPGPIAYLRERYVGEKGLALPLLGPTLKQENAK